MAQNVGKWSIQTAVDANGIRTGIAQITGMMKSASSTITAGLAGIGGGIAFSQFRRATEAADDIGFLNEQLGTSIEWLSSLQMAAGESGVSTQQFGSSVNRLQQTLGNAVLGSTEAQSSFRDLGLDWRRLSSQGFEQTFSDVAQALYGVSDRAQRARLAVELFGREGGQRMLRLFQEGAAGVTAAIADVQNRGGGLTEESLARIREADAAMDAAATRWTASWRDFNAAVAPAVAGTINFLSERLNEIAIGWRNIIREFQTTPAPSPTQSTQERDSDAASLEFQRGALARRVEQGRDLAARMRAATTETERREINQEIVALNQQTRQITEVIRIIEQRLQRPLGQNQFGQSAASTFGPSMQELNAGQQQFTNSIADATNAIARQNEAYGMTANEATRLRFIQQGASAEQLRAFDEQIARQQQLTNGAREMANVRQLALQARSPQEILRARLNEIDRSGLNAEQRGRLISQALPQRQETPLLGAMNADSSEVALILQGAMTPQTDAAQEQVALIRELLDENRENGANAQQIANDVRELLRFAQG